jgi:hypothetical protein
MPREDKQVLTVAAHPGSQVVYPEQQIQLLRILLMAFQLLHDLEQ